MNTHILERLEFWEYSSRQLCSHRLPWCPPRIGHTPSTFLQSVLHTLRLHGQCGLGNPLPPSLQEDPPFLLVAAGTVQLRCVASLKKITRPPCPIEAVSISWAQGSFSCKQKKQMLQFLTSDTHLACKRVVRHDISPSYHLFCLVFRSVWYLLILLICSSPQNVR